MFEKIGKNLQLIKAGAYKAVIVDSRIKETVRRVDGIETICTHLDLCFKITDGIRNGRCISSSMSIFGMSDNVIEESKQKLADICNCAGILKTTCAEDLLGIKLNIEVDIFDTKLNAKIITSNIITAYRPLL